MGLEYGNQFVAMVPLEEDEDFQYLVHYGTPRHSGRYPWGSGENPYQRSKDFKSHYDSLRKKGWTDKQIAESMSTKDNPMSINQLRARVSVAGASVRKADVEHAMKLKEKGYSTSAIARNMGVNESTVRQYLNPEIQRRKDLSMSTYNLLADQVKQYKYVDVGSGEEARIGVSKTKMKYALEMLKISGYRVQEVYVDQPGSKGKKKTKHVVLVKEDTPTSEIYENLGKIAIPNKGVYSEDEGDTFSKVEVPVSVDPKRIYINYTKMGKNGLEGGVEKDGVIELRPGVDDISLGRASYAQVRIRVGEDKYMKGMAVYSDKIPEGYDIVYNTNKTVDKANKVFKDMNLDPKTGEIDRANPFGATIRMDDESNEPDLIRCQRHYTDSRGRRQQSALNIVNEEGNWEEWGRTLSAQMLSKQRPALAKQQLKIAYDRKLEEFNEIMKLTNPTIQRQLLEDFADGCDSSAVHLKAAAIPGSASHVILPILSLRENEVFAPGYEDGTRLALIRYPHGGIFEIADVTVNNRNREGQKVIGNDAPDAIGIHPKVAAKLSGADFDGDTVTVIPNDNGAIISSPALKGLKDYEPKILYAKGPDDIKTGKPKHGEDPSLYDGFDTQRQMGSISNLITDMTIQKAPVDEICRAVRHSMTVIDAEKHNLDWKRSYDENRIRELKERYQGVGKNGMLKGASTLISKAKKEIQIDEVKEGRWDVDPVTGKGHRQFYDPVTGERLYSETGRTYTKWRKDKDGNWVNKGEEKYKSGIPSMLMYKDAHELSTGTVIEEVYADHANRLKSLANRARLESMKLSDITYNKEAAQVFKPEVDSLRGKLRAAEANRPLERRAHALAASLFKEKLADDPRLEYDGDRKRKEQSRLLVYSRKVVGSHRERIVFSDAEWKAIQSGAVTPSFLKNLIKECDKDALKQRAMPREWKGLSPSKLSRARQMLDNGASAIEVAQALGVSKSTLYDALKDS